MPLQRREEIRDYYRSHDVVARYMERRTAQPLNGALHAAQVRFLRQQIAASLPSRILEIAPGPGRLTAEIEPRGVGLCVEYSEAMLAAARERVPASRGWAFARGDAFDLPVRDAKLDFVFALRFIRRFQPAERKRLYAEVQRVLRPGGLFVFDAQNRTVALPHRERKGPRHYPVYDALYELPELTTELSEAGFRILRVHGIMKHSRLQRRINRLRLLGWQHLARRLIEMIEWIPGRNPSTWLVLARGR